MFTAFTALNHRLGNRLFDKRISHIGKSRITVKTGIMLHFHNAVLNKLSFVFIKLKLVGKIFVALYELCGTKISEGPRCFRAWSSITWATE